jgi:hypothetical protein
MKVGAELVFTPISDAEVERVEYHNLSQGRVNWFLGKRDSKAPHVRSAPRGLN